MKKQAWLRMKAQQSGREEYCNRGPGPGYAKYLAEKRAKSKIDKKAEAKARKIARKELKRKTYFEPGDNGLIRYSESPQNFPKELNHMRIFSDGSCSYRDRIGGYAFIIHDMWTDNITKEAGGQSDTTSNRMELMGVIAALRLLTDFPCTIEFILDSQYVGKGIAFYRVNWKKGGWKCKNADLWQELDALLEPHDVYVTWVRGHAGHKENEECDKMAGAARADMIYFMETHNAF